MKENLFSINPYAVLGVSQSASTTEITRAMAEAMKRKQFPVDVIAKAQKGLINPQKRILADYLSPILPIIQRFKRQDYSALNSPAPTLEFLPQFDELDVALARTHSIAPTDAVLGQILFSSVSSTSSSVSHSNELEENYLDAGQFDETEQPFSSLSLPVLEPLESDASAASEFSRASQLTRVKFLVVITSLIPIAALLTARSDIFSLTSSVPTPSPLITASDQASSTKGTSVTQPVTFTPEYEPIAEISSNAISTTPARNSTPQSVPTPSSPLGRVTQQSPHYSFPADTCGDHDPGGTNTWYPVYVNYSERNLSLIQSHYCRDAIRKYRETIGLHSIQITSFLNRADAQEGVAESRYELGRNGYIPKFEVVE